MSELFLAAEENDLFLNIVLIPSLISAGAECEAGLNRFNKSSRLLLLLNAFRFSKHRHRLSFMVTRGKPAFVHKEMDFQQDLLFICSCRQNPNEFLK